MDEEGSCVARRDKTVVNNSEYFVFGVKSKESKIHPDHIDLDGKYGGGVFVGLVYEAK